MSQHCCSTKSFIRKGLEIPSRRIPVLCCTRITGQASRTPGASDASWEVLDYTWSTRLVDVPGTEARDATREKFELTQIFTFEKRELVRE